MQKPTLDEHDWLSPTLEILDEDGEVLWSADLVEDGDQLDREAAEYRDAVPTFHGLSRGGEAQGRLIYANYGRKEDYDELVEAGVDLTGAIVIVRYGAIFRGLKVCCDLLLPGLNILFI